MKRQVVTLGIANVANFAVNLFTPIVLVRVLDESSFGEYRLLLLTAGTLLEIVPFGMPCSLDCSRCYGHSVLISHVQSLGEDSYRETAVDTIAPGWRKDALRVHTVGGKKRLRVIDCMTRRQLM